MFESDEIVEDRIWRGSVEIVSRVNWSHVARVRRALGLAESTAGFVRLVPTFTPAQAPARVVEPAFGLVAA